MSWSSRSASILVFDIHLQISFSFKDLHFELYAEKKSLKLYVYIDILNINDTDFMKEYFVEQRFYTVQLKDKTCIFCFLSSVLQVLYASFMY